MHVAHFYFKTFQKLFNGKISGKTYTYEYNSIDYNLLPMTYRKLTEYNNNYGG